MKEYNFEVDKFITGRYSRYHKIEQNNFKIDQNNINIHLERRGRGTPYSNDNKIKLQDISLVKIKSWNSLVWGCLAIIIIFFMVFVKSEYDLKMFLLMLPIASYLSLLIILYMISRLILCGYPNKIIKIISKDGSIYSFPVCDIRKKEEKQKLNNFIDTLKMQNNEIEIKKTSIITKVIMMLIIFSSIIVGNLWMIGIKLS